MKNVLIVSGHPELDTSIANQTILSEVIRFILITNSILKPNRQPF